MSLEQSIEKLAEAIFALAASRAPEVEKPAGKPAATRAAADKAVKTETATESRSEGKTVSTAAADTPPTVEEGAADAPASKEISYEDTIKPLFLKLVQAKGRDAGRAFIDGYKPGTPKLSDAIKPAQYAAVVSALEELLA